MRSMPARLVTAAELLRLPRGRQRHELRRGELRTMSPAGWRHGVVAARFLRLLAAHVARAGLGETLAAETGFLLARDPDTVLAPDVSFVRHERIAGISPRGFFPGPPDLAVEVRSPDESRQALADKARDWLAHGCPLVVTIDPESRSALVYRQDQAPLTVAEDATIDATDVVPGFSLPLAGLFAE
jgi:Uma2 family endonuclease